jgi:hypothetical protein
LLGLCMVARIPLSRFFYVLLLGLCLVARIPLFHFSMYGC